MVQRWSLCSLAVVVGGGVLCCRVVDKLTGVFWWWGGVACADRESECRFKWSLETALDFV